MCDLFLQNYSTALNSSTDVTQDDLQPTLILFDNFNCSGVFYPSSPTTGSFVNDGYVIGELFDVPFKPASLYIPFGIGTVQFHSSAFGVDFLSTFQGPH